MADPIWRIVAEVLLTQIGQAERQFVIHIMRHTELRSQAGRAALSDLAGAAHGKKEFCIGPKAPVAVIVDGHHDAQARTDAKAHAALIFDPAFFQSNPCSNVAMFARKLLDHVNFVKATVILALFQRAGEGEGFVQIMVQPCPNEVSIGSAVACAAKSLRRLQLARVMLRQIILDRRVEPHFEGIIGSMRSSGHRYERQAKHQFWQNCGFHRTFPQRSFVLRPSFR